jgi:hypothetical protein
MDPASLAEANEKLARPPDFDLSNSAQLGLFVVGRLAQRHSIQVTLRTSPYGGTTAIVLLPDTIVVRSGEQGEIGSGGRPALTRRGEDALVPIGAIGPPSFGGPVNGTDTGPMPLTGGGADRPPLPQRGNHAGPPPQAPPAAPPYDGGYDTGSHPLPHETGPFGAGPGDPYDNRPYESGPRDNGYEPAPYETNSYDSGRDSAPPSPSFGGGGFGDGGYGSDTGQWNLPARQAPEDAGRPTLPRRHSEPPAPAAPSLPSVPPIPPIPSAPDPLGGQRRSLFEPADGPADTGTTPRPVGGAPQEPPASAPAGEAPGGAGRPSLPRRVRQASLAPQLRDEVEPVSDTASGERSPEELRTMLSSIQKGWLRGRSDAEQTASDHDEEDI